MFVNVLLVNCLANLYGVTYNFSCTLTSCSGFHDTRQNAELKEDSAELEETDGSILWENSGHAAMYYVGHDHEFRGYIVP